jgi:Tat protein secretion system quality control protein TatD with DNase activity
MDQNQLRTELHEATMNLGVQGQLMEARSTEFLAYAMQLNEPGMSHCRQVCHDILDQLLDAKARCGALVREIGAPQA